MRPWAPCRGTETCTDAEGRPRRPGCGSGKGGGLGIRINSVFQQRDFQGKKINSGSMWGAEQWPPKMPMSHGPGLCICYLGKGDVTDVIRDLELEMVLDGLGGLDAMPWNVPQKRVVEGSQSKKRSRHKYPQQQRRALPLEDH